MQATTRMLSVGVLLQDQSLESMLKVQFTKLGRVQFTKLVRLAEVQEQQKCTPVGVSAYFCLFLVLLEGIQALQDQELVLPRAPCIILSLLICVTVRGLFCRCYEMLLVLLRSP